MMARKICKFSLLQFYITSCFTLCQLDYLSGAFIIVARRSKAFSLKSRLHPHQPTRHIYNFWVSLPAVTLSIAKECVYTQNENFEFSCNRNFILTLACASLRLPPAWAYSEEDSISSANIISLCCVWAHLKFKTKQSAGNVCLSVLLLLSKLKRNQMMTLSSFHETCDLCDCWFKSSLHFTRQRRGAKIEREF